jgi:hypothetical protein
MYLLEGSCASKLYKVILRRGSSSPIRPPIPEGRKTIVTVLDEKVNHDRELAARKKLWSEIIKNLRNCDEAPEGGPEGYALKPRKKSTSYDCLCS